MRPLRLDGEEGAFLFSRQRLLDHNQLPTDMGRMQMAAIPQGVAGRRIEQVTGRNTHVLRLTGLQDQLSLQYGRR